MVSKKNNRFIKPKAQIKFKGVNKRKPARKDIIDTGSVHVLKYKVKERKKVNQRLKKYGYKKFTGKWNTFKK